MDARLKLQSFLKERGIKPGSFARSIDYDRANFHRLLNKDGTRPSLELAVKIERGTGGEILASSWAEAA
jgi:hypothetical protein